MAAAGWNALFFFINGRRLYQAVQKDRQDKQNSANAQVALALKSGNVSRVSPSSPLEPSKDSEQRRHKGRRDSAESFLTNPTDDSTSVDGEETPKLGPVEDEQHPLALDVCEVMHAEM